jgi:KDO2-lipid IV(A) lauroyltransferase
LPFIYLISVLPFPILYFASYIVYVIIYYFVGYRKDVVYQNLKLSFPEKTSEEISKLAKDFYRYFCDLLLETFKTLTISKNSMLRHCSIDEKSLALLNKLASEGQSILLVLGHKGNWEWAGNTFSLLSSYKLFVIYHPLANPYFDRLMYNMRSKFGTKLIPMADTFREMVKHKSELTATAFIADQTPQPDNAHWMNFLNQDTPVFLGTEKIATKMKRLVLFVSVQKIKRGYYQLVIDENDIMNPNNFSAGELTESHTKKLEKDIRQQPETWLWTHRRWKHKRNTKNYFV